MEIHICVCLHDILVYFKLVLFYSIHHQMYDILKSEDHSIIDVKHQTIYILEWQTKFHQPTRKPYSVFCFHHGSSNPLLSIPFFPSNFYVYGTQNIDQKI